MRSNTVASGLFYYCTTLFLLFAIPCFASISGTVTNTDGNPVSGALVTFTDESNTENVFSGYTDESGKYIIKFSPTSVGEDTPADFRLDQNYPNPFNPSTTIPFTLGETGLVNLSIYNIIGQKVRTLINSQYSTGSHSVIWNGLDDGGKNAAAGIYFYQLKCGKKVESRKMLLLDGGYHTANVNRGTAKSVTSNAGATYSITIHGSSIVVYRQNGITLGNNTTLDFVVKSLPTGMQLVEIPGGTFEMGDIANVGESIERPVHSVNISSFEMSKHEVTNSQYIAYLTEALASGEITASSTTVTGNIGEWNGKELLDIDDILRKISFTEGDFIIATGRENDPVITVSWYGAKAFAEYYGLDLPTEAEWEYACRAGSKTMFYTGNNLSSDGETSIDLDTAGWYLYNHGTMIIWQVETHPVGEKEPNQWGLYDMHGNAWEWCNDWSDGNYYASSRSSNPKGPSSGICRVVRGGNWRLSAWRCRSGHRREAYPVWMDDMTGFRVVRRPERPLSDTYTIRGRVLINDRDFLGVTVIMDGEKTITGSDGIYSFSGVSDGIYTIIFEKPGYTFNPMRNEVIVIGNDIITTDVTACESVNYDFKTNTTFVTIPPGTFQMGDEVGDLKESCRPVHTITVSGFEMSSKEITYAQYVSYLNEALASGDITADSTTVQGKTGNWNGKEYVDLDNWTCSISFSEENFRFASGGENWPVDNVSWYGAKAYAEYYGYDLPTEAEWEYACRGGKQYLYGTDDGTIGRGKAQYSEKFYGCLADVGRFPTNPFGLYDMSGNLSEWCNDWFDDYSSSNVIDPTGPSTGSTKVIRGGNFNVSDIIYCRSANRSKHSPDYSGFNVGFRVVRRPDGVIY